MKFSLTFFLIYTASLLYAQTADSVIDKMLLAIDEIEQLSFDFKSQERFKEKMVSSEGNAKIIHQPKKIYFKQISPDPVEILYDEEKNSTKALVKAKKLPVIHLSVYSNKMRKRSHYPITQLGFAPLAELLVALKEKGEVEMDLSNENIQGRACYKLELNFPSYQLEIYKTKQEEYPRDIAQKRKISEYKIIELNGLSSYGKIKAGFFLTLPNLYAKKIILTVDKESNLPVQQKIYDEQGIYEQYEYHNIKLNHQIPAQEFPKDLK